MPPTDPARRKFLAALLAVPVISSCDLSGDKKKTSTTETRTDTQTTDTGTTDKADTATDTNDTATDNTDTSGTTSKPTTDDGTTSSYNLSGLWGWTKPGFYKLKQSGASIQGTYFDPDIPEARGAIAGSVSGDIIKLTIAVTYSTHPEDNFTAIKTGTIHSSKSMTLTVTGGPKYVGQVQQWSKISTV